MPVIAPDESVGLNALSRLARVFEAAVFLAVTFLPVPFSRSLFLLAFLQRLVF